MKRSDAQAFMNRPWGLFEELRGARRRRTDGALQLAETLRRSVRDESSPRGRALGRQLDFEHHLRLKQLLERAGAAWGR